MRLPSFVGTPALYDKPSLWPLCSQSDSHRCEHQRSIEWCCALNAAVCESCEALEYSKVYLIYTVRATMTLVVSIKVKFNFIGNFPCNVFLFRVSMEVVTRRKPQALCISST